MADALNKWNHAEFVPLPAGHLRCVPHPLHQMVHVVSAEQGARINQLGLLDVLLFEVTCSLTCKTSAPHVN
jgi:hypothetical protein